MEYLGHPPPPPPRDWPQPSFNAFAPRHPSKSVAPDVSERFFFSSAEETCWKAALKADIDAMRASFADERVPAHIRLRESEVSTRSGEKLAWPPAKFLRWGLRQYILLQKLIASESLRIEKYDEILRVLDEQEDAHVQLILAKAERDASNDDSIHDEYVQRKSDWPAMSLPVH